MGTPRLTIAAALGALVAVAATMTYTGYLVVGVLADYLGTGRFVAGLLLGVLFARFPWMRDGQPRIVGLLPKPVRRPLTIGLLALCLLRFATQGASVPALFAGLTLLVLLAFPWLWKMLLARMASSFINVAGGRSARGAADDTVIEGEFREMKE